MRYNALIEDLKNGKTIQFRPRGNSMLPKIKSGELVTVEPSSTYEKGDIVLCKVNGSIYLHLINAIAGNKYQIANNRGHINGWTNQIFGKVTKIE